MRKIPIKLRNHISSDPFMRVCIYNDPSCKGRIEWEHAFLYAGKQINERWAIIPCCTFHHRGAGLDKDYNQYRALLRATDKELEKFPKKDFKQLSNYFKKKYDNDRERNSFNV